MRSRVAVLAVAASCSARPPASPVPPHGHTLFVGGEGGLVAYDIVARASRPITATPAARPRFVPGSQDLVFYSPPRRELRRIGRDGRGERVIATLPATVAACGDAAPIAIEPLRIENDADLTVTAAEACLAVMDRNQRMADRRVSFRIGLDGTVAYAVEQPACSPSPACTRGRWPSVAPRPAGAPQLAIRDDGKLVRGTEVIADLGASELGPLLHSELLAPSQDWELLAGTPEEGDYIHRRLFVLHQTDGAIFPLRPGPWPAALTAAELARTAEIETVDAVGESAVFWLPEDDVAVIDHLLVVAGRSIEELPGDVAR